MQKFRKELFQTIVCETLSAIYSINLPVTYPGETSKARKHCDTLKNFVISFCFCWLVKMQVNQVNVRTFGNERGSKTIVTIDGYKFFLDWQTNGNTVTTVKQLYQDYI